MRSIMTFERVFRIKIDILKLLNECTKYKRSEWNLEGINPHPKSKWSIMEKKAKGKKNNK